MKLISAPFQLFQPFPSLLPPSIVAMRIELFVLQWSSVTSQLSQRTLIKSKGWKEVISNTDKVKICANFAIAQKKVGYKYKISSIFINIYARLINSQYREPPLFIALRGRCIRYAWPPVVHVW